MENAQHKRFFVSYSRKDRGFVEPMVAVIRTAGAEVFRDQDSISPGKKWRLVLDDAIEQSDAVIIFWSSNSSISEHVRQEYEKAIELRKDVIPVIIDGEKLPPELEQFQYIDFRLLPGPPFSLQLHQLAQDIVKRVMSGPEDVWLPD